MRSTICQIETHAACALIRRARSLLCIEPRHTSVPPCQRGFTLVELVMVMIIIGILAVFVAPRFFDVNIFQERGAADQVKAALRYGQKIAIAQRRKVSVQISSGTASECGAQLTGGNVACVISGSVTVVPPLPKTVKFTAMGQPLDEFDVPLSANDTLTVGSILLTVERETGYVH